MQHIFYGSSWETGRPLMQADNHNRISQRNARLPLTRMQRTEAPAERSADRSLEMRLHRDRPLPMPLRLPGNPRP